MKNSGQPETEIDQRHAQVIGDGPRILPLKPEELDDHVMVINERIRSIAQRDNAPKSIENLNEYVGTLFRHPDLFEKMTEVGLQFSKHGALPPRERELIILRIAWLCKAPYEFGEHVLIARNLGIFTAEIEAIVVGSSAAIWSELERAVLLAVEELFYDAMISDETWAVMAKHFDDRQLIELPLIIGQYQQLAYLQNSLRLSLHPGNDGLKAR